MLLMLGGKLLWPNAPFAAGMLGGLIKQVGTEPCKGMPDVGACWDQFATPGRAPPTAATCLTVARTERQAAMGEEHT